MTKIMSAQSILKEKGFVQNKFDTNGFMNAVGRYFLENGVEDKLLLVPFRFLDISADGDFPYNPFNITDEEEKLGYKAQTERDGRGRVKYIVDLFENNFEEYRKEQDAGLLVPRIIVDKPFFENAAATLRLMGGYVVEKQMKKKRKLYWVTLI